MARAILNGRVTRAGQMVVATALGICATLAYSPLALASAVQGKVFFPPASEVKTAQIMAKVYRRFPVTQTAATAVTQYQVVVTVDVPSVAAPAAPVVITSNGYLLEPTWLVVPVGTEVKFENLDRFALSLEISGEARPPTLKHGDTYVHKFSKPGLHRIAAREWEHMRANVLVVENKVFATPDNSGVFKIADVQSGVKTARVYVDGQEVAKTDVQVPSDADIWVEVKVDAEGKATAEVRGNGLLPTNAKPEVGAPPPAAPKPEAKAEPKPKPKPKPKPQPKPAEPAAGGSEAPPPPPPPPAEDDDE